MRMINGMCFTKVISKLKQKWFINASISTSLASIAQFAPFLCFSNGLAEKSSECPKEIDLLREQQKQFDESASFSFSFIQFSLEFNLYLWRSGVIMCETWLIVVYFQFAYFFCCCKSCVDSIRFWFFFCLFVCFFFFVLLFFAVCTMLLCSCVCMLRTGCPNMDPKCEHCVGRRWIGGRFPWRW